MSTVTIYALSDARAPHTIRYVGKSIDPTKRLAGHVRDSKRSSLPVSVWLRALLGGGGMVAGYEIERVPDSLGAEAEAYWIRALAERGHPLLNRTHNLSHRQATSRYRPAVSFSPKQVEPAFAWPFSWRGVKSLLREQSRAAIMAEQR